MDALNPLFAITLIAIVVCYSSVAIRFIQLPDTNGRYAAIDGLRGYAALLVVIHHAAVWFYYLTQHRWALPESHFYIQCGQASVAFFFMITGFLFSSKILRIQHQEFDWCKLLVSRFIRLFPMYGFAVSLVIFSAGMASGFELKEPMHKIFYEIIQWYTFSLLGNPDVNGFAHTVRIASGVIWTLRYEWFFYCSLPVLGLIFRKKIPAGYAVFGLLSVSVFILLLHARPDLYFSAFYLLFFSTGILVSLFNQYFSIPKQATSAMATLVAMLCLGWVFIFSTTAYSWSAWLLLSVVFLFVANGNTLVGLLDARFARYLGEISYSVYLLHGIVLFNLWQIFGGLLTQHLNPLLYWSITISIVPIILMISHITFVHIESPLLRRVDLISQSVRLLVGINKKQ